MTAHDHHHDHDHSDLSETELRVRALESILTEKGYVDPAALDLLIETYETTQDFTDLENIDRARPGNFFWMADPGA